MLLNLHVKNLALIDEAEVDFGDHLNILTGETGAGKSIIIGSVAMGFGGRIQKNIIRKGAEYGLISMLFSVDHESAFQELLAAGIAISEDRELLITRKIYENRVINKINDETVTVSKLKEIAGILIDMHAQHDQQELLTKKNHLRLIDRYGEQETARLLDQLKISYDALKKIEKEKDEASTDAQYRKREIDFLQFEIDEIKKAQLVIGEDDELERVYKKNSNNRQIAVGTAEMHQLTGYDVDTAAGNQISRAQKELYGIVQYDEDLNHLSSQLSVIEDLLNEFNRDLSEYISSLSVDEEELMMTERRLDLINGLKTKYGQTIPEILDYCEQKEQELNQLLHHEEYVASLEAEYSKQLIIYDNCAKQLHEKRVNVSKKMTEQIRQALMDLNFLDVQFETRFEERKQRGRDGLDDVCFMISTNVGEGLRPLYEVASGGELSRIMLAVKSTLADKEETDTLIFDEIDVGISGRTAQMVSAKLSLLAKNHQVICITHLPQIAAMADNHFLIEKNVINDKTVTSITPLDEEKSIMELARMMGGVEITGKVIENAKEMKNLAYGVKLY